jgi:peptidoglycan/LPS O-acetylase OafA/YrhL
MHKILSIQFMRAVACLLVIQQHFFPYIPFTNYRVNGTIGVDLFFVISGYIIAASIERLKDQRFNTFVINRFSRIIPYYFLLTVALILIDYIRSHPADIYRVVHTFMFIPSRNFDPYIPLGWSLNHEVLFYFFVAISLLFTNNILRIALAFFICITLCHFFPSTLYIKEFISASINYTFLCGMLIYVYRHHIIKMFEKNYFFLVLSIVGIIFVMFFTMDHQLNTHLEPIIPTSGYFRDTIYFNGTNVSFPRFYVQGIISVIFFISLLSREHRFDGMSKNILIKIGNASFSEYLLQIFPLRVVLMLHLGMLASIPLVIGLIAFSLYFVQFENYIGNKTKKWLNVLVS